MEDPFEDAQSLYEHRLDDARLHSYTYIGINTTSDNLLLLREYLEKEYNYLIEDLESFLEIGKLEPGNLLGIKNESTPEDQEPEFLFFVYYDGNEVKYSYVMGEDPGDSVGDLPGIMVSHFGDYWTQIGDTYNLPFKAYGQEEWTEIDE